MPYVDATFPDLSVDPSPLDERKYRRTIKGTIQQLPDSDWSSDPDAIAGSGTDRASAFAGLPVAIEAGRGAVPGLDIDMLGYAFAGASLQETADVTGSTTLSIEKWRTYQGRVIICNAGTAFTITIDDSAITGTAQGGATGFELSEDGGDLPYITLAASASSTDDEYRGLLVSITSGTGAGQAGEPRRIVSYDGTAKRAYVQRDWAVVPDATSVYSLAAPAGFNAMVYQKGAGAVTVAAGGGLTRRGSFTKTSGQYALAAVMTIGSDLVIKGEAAA